MTKTYSDELLAAMSAEQLEDELRHHNHLYWDLNQPEISDYDYDRLVNALRRARPDSPLLDDLGPSLVGRYGAPVAHTTPMLSLDKCYDDETLASWAAKFSGAAVVTPKMDGIAASLRYDEHGRLSLAATRGNGTVGDDITANVRTIADIPHKVEQPGIEVRGEIYMRLSVFATFGEQFSNPRNLAAGAIKSKEPARCRQYRLSFAAYDLLGSDHDSEQQKFAYLQRIGFPPVEFVVAQRSELRAGYEHFAERRAALDFEIDGVVFKVDDVAQQRQMGATAHHPRYGIAYKFQGDSSTTRLKAVEWSVARSGAITPVAIIAPVTLSGATVSRASLHHAGFIAKLGLTIGADVVVTRRGGVIPNVEFVARAGEGEVTLPERCPSCGGEVVSRGDFLHCAQPERCRNATIGTIAHFCKVVDIQGFGEKLLAEAYERGALRSPADLFTLTKEQLLALERVGEKLATKLLRQVADHRQLDLAVFLRALGIEELGPHVSAILAERYQTLERVRAATVDELAEIHTIGAIIAEKVVGGLAAAAPSIEQLLAHVELREGAPAKAPTAGPLAGRSFVFTGKLVAFDRKSAQKMVAEAGGTTPSGVTKDLDYLVIGAGKAGKKSSKQLKAEKAIAAGAPLSIISEDEFLEMIGG